MDDLSTGLLDVAVTPTAGATDSGSTNVDTPVVDSDIANVDVESGADVSTDTTVEGTDEGSAGETNPDGTPKVDPTNKVDTTPQEIRSALKALRDSNPNDPKIAAAVKQLHGNYERYEAVRKEVPGGIGEIRAQQQFLRELAGVEAGAPVTLQQAREAYARTMDIINNVNESDQLLYNGDGDLIKHIYEDMKSEGVQANFAKLADPFLATLQQNDPAGYYKAVTPHIVAQLNESGFPSVLSRLLTATKGTPAAEVVNGMVKWWNSAVDGVEKAKQGPTPEQEQFNKERTEFEQKKVRDFQASVASEAHKSDITKLGAELKVFLQKPYFKAFKTENLRPLANQIQVTLQEELQADKAYQVQMKALWGAKSPDKAKLLQYHNAKVESIAGRIVRDTVQKMYPDHARGGSAAGRVAAAAQKKAEQAKADAQQKVQSVGGKLPTPQYVATKPKNINREMDKGSLLEIGGKGWIPDGRGGWRLVSWRKS